MIPSTTTWDLDSAAPRHARLFAYGPKMRALRYQVEQVAVTDVPVLVRGEHGVGKDRVARAVHAASGRCPGAFIRVSCDVVPPELIDRELFGQEANGFSGRGPRRRGMIERADGGTLALDEIGELPLPIQAKLVRFLQDAEITRRKGSEVVKVDVRVLAITSRNLETAVRRGDFLADLLHRLNVVTIDVPPLRERRGEIRLLAKTFLRRFNVEFDRNLALSPDAMRSLETHDWPGNIRELSHMMRRLVLLNRSVVEPDDFAQTNGVPEPKSFSRPPLAGGVTPPPKPLALKDIARRAARDAERAVINDALDRSQGNRAQAARLLRISYKALLYKMAQCGLTRKVLP